MELRFVGQSARDADNLTGATSRLVNVYSEPTVGGQPWLKSVLGMEEHAQLDGVFVRAMEEVGGVLYAACGGNLVSIAADGSIAILGAVTDGADATISGNNGKVLCCIGGKYYMWDGLALTEPAAGAFSSFGSVTYLANYTILTEVDGIKFQWSALGDASDLDGLNFATADGRDDKIVRALAINGILWIFKQTSREAWYETGQPGPDAFLRMAGGVYDVGLAGFGLIAPIVGSAFLIGSDGRAHLVNGNGLQPISTPPVETAIKTAKPKHCFSYDDEGHTFCVVTFEDCPAWVYDVATGEWHERAEGADLGPWGAAVAAKWNGRWYVGRDTGEVSVMRRTNRDGALPLVREVTSETLRLDGRRFAVRELELFPRQGLANGTMGLTLSRDGGLTWGEEKARAVGPVGNYGGRIIWRNLGLARQLTAKVRWSDPAEINLNTLARVVL